MAKLYTKNEYKKINNLNPKDETVSFLLNFSKAYTVLEGKTDTFDVLLN